MTDSTDHADIRLCQICLWSNYDGFGFGIKKNSAGPHIINMVESNSPASIGGLQLGDLILAVNRYDVSKKEFDKVHKIIKTVCDTQPLVELLVMGQTHCDTLKYRDILTNATLWTVITTPVTMPAEFSDFPQLIPRVYRLRLDRNDKKFGFQIHIGDNNVGAYVRQVFANSPASHAGLRKCDRIIEIDDRNVDQHSGENIMKKMEKAVKKGEVKLFVADTHTHRYYVENQIKFDSANTKKAVSSFELQTVGTSNRHQTTNHQVLPKRDDSSALPPRSASSTTTKRQNIAKKKSKDERYSSIETIDREKKLTMGRRFSQLFSGFERNNRDDKAASTGENYQEVASTPRDRHNPRGSTHSLNIDGDTNNRCNNQEDNFLYQSSSVTNIHDSINSSKLDRRTIRHEYSSDSDNDQTSKYQFSPNNNADLSASIDEDDRNAYFSSQDNATIDRYPRCASFDVEKKPIQSNYESSIAVTCVDKYASTRKKTSLNLASPRITRSSGTLPSKLPDLNDETVITLKKGSYSASVRMKPRKDNISNSRTSLNQAVTDDLSNSSLVVKASNGTIELRYGDITKQTVDAIAVASTSSRLRNNILQEAGDSVRTIYDTRYRQQNDSSIYTNGGNLLCKRIYFIPCPQLSRNADKWVFRKFVTEAIRMATSDCTTSIRSIAFPAIGCGQYSCNSNFVAKTLILAVAYELEQQPSLRFEVSFVVERQQQTIFDAFQKELMAFKDNGPVFQPASLRSLPPRIPNREAIRRPFVLEKRPLDKSSGEYNTAVKEFTAMMTPGLYSEIVSVELVWNECWYKQYEIHKNAFLQRLKTDTEKLLFHGCSEDSANNIIKNCFNRSYAGKNGVVYGHGVYFSSKASYSHSYTSPNSKGERCMFLAKVLIGNTTRGTSGTKVCPIGYDSTTNGTHIYVIYHDAQAFGQYLITYK